MKKQDIKNGMLVRIKDGGLLYIITKIKTKGNTFIGYDSDGCPIIDDVVYKEDLSLNDDDLHKEYTIVEIYSEINRDISKGLFSTENRTLLWKEDDKNFKEYLIDTSTSAKIYADYIEESILITPNYVYDTFGYKDKEHGNDVIYLDISRNRLKDNHNKTDSGETVCTSLTIEKAKEVIKTLTEIVEYVEGE